MGKNSYDDESNIMRAIALRQILINRGLTYEGLVKMIKKHFPDDETINKDALKVSMSKKLGKDWCEKIEIVLDLPKDTLTNIK